MGEIGCGWKVCGYTSIVSACDYTYCLLLAFVYYISFPGRTGSVSVLGVVSALSLPPSHSPSFPAFERTPNTHQVPCLRLPLWTDHKEREVTGWPIPRSLQRFHHPTLWAALVPSWSFKTGLGSRDFITVVVVLKSQLFLCLLRGWWES